MDIKSLINKVIASKGILRVPSWWMKKLLTEIVGYIDSGDSANANSIVKAKKEADSKISTLESEIKDILLNLMRSLHTQKCFVVETGSSSGYVIVDDVRQDIPANTKKVITYTDNFSFYADGNNVPNYIIFIRLSVSDTSAITSMASMFRNCALLTSIDFTGLDTSNVTNMSYMFSQCSKLTSLDLSSFDTSSVTDMQGMFNVCLALTSLDLSSFDTSKVINMQGMFYRCSALTSLDLSSFDTSKVINMQGMFGSCYYLTSLDLSSFDTSSVTDMSIMFNSCSDLTSLDLSSFDTSAVTNMSQMFSYCRSLTSLDLSSFDTSKVINMQDMFGSCDALTSLILGPSFFKTSKVSSINFFCPEWTNDTVITSLVTNSYDRASAGLNTLTLQLHANTKAALSDEQKAAITSKGYTIA